jgi:hypothetical protein
MKRWLRSGVLAAAMLAGCTGLRVDLDYDPARNFSAYHSYAWLPAAVSKEGEAVIRNDLVEARVMSAVDNELNARKMQRADKDSADFLVTYHINVENRVDVRTIDTGFGSRYHPWWGWNSRDTETIVQNYKAGTLVLDIIDRKTDKLAWRASAETRLRDGLTPQQRDTEVRNIVGLLMKNFPPGAAPK